MNKGCCRGFLHQIASPRTFRKQPFIVVDTRFLVRPPSAPLVIKWPANNLFPLGIVGERLRFITRFLLNAYHDEQLQADEVMATQERIEYGNYFPN